VKNHNLWVADWSSVWLIGDLALLSSA